MNTCRPEIAVLLATYNGRQYLSAQLDSLLRQTYPDLKIYIHDDGSTDGTPDLLRAYAEQYPARIVLLPGEAAGSACRNFLYLFRQVEAQYYMCCDQDDVWHPEKAARTFAAMQALETEPSVPCLVHTDLAVADKHLHIISRSMDRYQHLCCSDSSLGHILAQNTVTGCTMMINRALRELLQKPIDADRMIMHDWWLALAAAAFGRLQYLSAPTILYRQHGHNALGAQKMGLSLLLHSLSPERIREIRRSLRAKQQQAREFARVYGLGQESIVWRYGHMERLRKPARLRFYRRCGIHMGTGMRTLGMYLFG